MGNLLVTGGAGFIGSHVVDRLADRGDQVIVLDDLSTGSLDNLARWRDDARVRVIEGDVAEDLGGPLSGVGPVTGIVHLAAQVSVVRSIARPLADLRTNARGTVQVLEFARRQPTPPKVVFASSAAVYGDVTQVPTPEDAPTRPLSPYGIDKLTSEHWLRFYSDVHGVPTSALRFFNVYGPRQDPSSAYSGVISIFIERSAAGLPITIYGDGEQTRDFVYVADVSRAIVAALDHPSATEPANVATGRTLTVRALAEKLVEIQRSATEISHGPGREGEVRHSHAIVARLRELFEVSATTSLDEGLRATCDAVAKTSRGDSSALR